ncbi:MAG: hypothetical protein ACRYHQ_29545 [Janthinobacterium lividum]
MAGPASPGGAAGAARAICRQRRQHTDDGDQAAWIAALESGRAGLPDQAAMAADIQRERAGIARLYPDSPRYGLELDPVQYRRDLAEVRRQRA